MRFHHRLGMAVAVVGLASSSCIWDVNKDGTIVIACLGDSNTSYPFFGNYCEQIAAAHPNIKLINYAVPGAKAVGGTNDGAAQIAAADVGDPANGKPPADFVVLAFGTNDIGGNGAITATEMADRIDTLKAAASAAGMVPFVASIPPRFVARALETDPCTPNPGASPVIAAADVLIQQRIDPLWFIDFYTGVTCPAHFYTDGVHINQAGQDLRAARTAERLFYVPPPPP
jgi:lysophospholipase L1-like esterase